MMYCNPCGEIMHRVHGTSEDGVMTCTGFYCPKCKSYEKSIGRERKLPISSNSTVRELFLSSVHGVDAKTSSNYHTK